MTTVAIQPMTILDKLVADLVGWMGQPAEKVARATFVAQGQQSIGGAEA